MNDTGELKRGMKRLFVLRVAKGVKERSSGRWCSGSGPRPREYKLWSSNPRSRVQDSETLVVDTWVAARSTCRKRIVMATATLSRATSPSLLSSFPSLACPSPSRRIGRADFRAPGTPNSSYLPTYHVASLVRQLADPWVPIAIEIKRRRRIGLTFRGNKFFA